MESSATDRPQPDVTDPALSPAEHPGNSASSTASTESREGDSRITLYAGLAAVGMILLFVLLTAGLYTLGDESQSTLERLRDIAIIYVVLTSLILVVLMAAATAAMVYLIIQIRNRVIPLLEETTGTLNRVRGTTEFMSEEAVRPVISAAGKVAQWRAMFRVATGREPR